jgi:hypothetical protein
MEQQRLLFRRNSTEGSESSTAANAGSSNGSLVHDALKMEISRGNDTKVESSQDEGERIENIIADHAEELARKCADAEAAATATAEEIASQAKESAIAERTKNQETTEAEAQASNEAEEVKRNQYGREVDEARRKVESAEAEAKALSGAAAVHRLIAPSGKQEGSDISEVPFMSHLLKSTLLDDMTRTVSAILELRRQLRKIKSNKQRRK